MKRLITVLASPVLMVTLLLFFGIAMGVATFVESRQSTEVAWKLVYNAKWFELIMLLGAVNLSFSVFTRKLYRLSKFSIFLFHISFVVIILGAGVTRYTGLEGTIQIREGQQSDLLQVGKSETLRLPFYLYLDDFVIDYYPGSQNPSGFKSKVVLVDAEKGIEEPREVYMNHILKHRGYRFYQSSYHTDFKGTVLSVSRDPIGSTISYMGYFLLALGMAWSLLNRQSRFLQLLFQKKTITLTCILFLAVSSPVWANVDSIPVIPAEHASKFGDLLVRDEQGRTKSVNTLAEDVFRKVYRKTNYQGQSALQVLLGMYVYPEQWQHAKLVYAGKNVPSLIGLEGKYASLSECYAGNGFFISSMEALKAYQLPPAQRSKAQNDLIRFDERLNILYYWFGGQMLNVFPSNSDSSSVWYNPINLDQSDYGSDTAYLHKLLPLYFSEVRTAMQTGNWQLADELISSLNTFQLTKGKNLPSARLVQLEKWYYKTYLFKRIASLYLWLGLMLLIVGLIKVFIQAFRSTWLQKGITILIGLVLFAHTAGLALRWAISGHAPWSNAYESMVFIAWSGVFAGIIFARKNSGILAVAALLAWVYLFAGHMSWMDPQITNLVPVLKSKWLVIHVAVITSSYGFLGVGSIMAFINILLLSIRGRQTRERIDKNIDELTRIIELSLTIGLYLLTVGTFLGAIWANVSWGRYWAWDPKETWALITVLVYAVVLHLRLIPATKGVLLFNFSSLVAYASVMMTYFGVNYFLSGLHSYAAGDPMPVPNGVYIAMGVILVLTLAAWLNQRWLGKVDALLEN
ncbi:MAG: cytochrome c biogenesis protein CcsA [Bacteroidota bacterium]|nr:MAG: cytochrome c biogenesis protein CcsA [Bacteroidota bacterium]